MFGESFLVAPVVTPSHRRQVYLPAGEWIYYWTRDVHTGGRWVEVEAPLEVLPLWVRAGTIVPMGPERAYVEEETHNPLTLELYRPQGEAETMVYDEDGADIAVKYLRQDGQLAVEVGAAPGEVEIVLYGLGASSASRGGQPLEIADLHGVQRVHFDGTTSEVVSFTLVPE
jgi:alpha-glucosidase (family GH31 glycosyl hydrolase)